MSPGDCNQINVVDDEDNDVSRLDLVKIHKYSFFSHFFISLSQIIDKSVFGNKKKKDKIKR